MTAPRGVAFPFRVSGGRIAASAGAAKVSDNLRHLLSTRLGERPMLRGYGGGVQHRLQQPNDHTLRTLIRHEIEQALRIHLPQARLLGPIRLTHRESELAVALDYAVGPTGQAELLELSLTRSP